MRYSLNNLLLCSAIKLTQYDKEKIIDQVISNPILSQLNLIRSNKRHILTMLDPEALRILWILVLGDEHKLADLEERQWEKSSLRKKKNLA
ncbi:hypothetical protein HYD71_00870 [Mycoplasmopsis bovis]|nr:hypothetical protein [Mycoplasmopsis bovis]QQH49464.1 hypothetical protein HYD71_00870 [Mycoplasmopsis bovis]